MAQYPVVAAYNATDEATDGLALADLLVRLTDAELVIARVLRDMVEHPAPAPLAQLEIRRRIMEARRAVVAAIPGEADADIVPLLDPNLARSLHAFADAQAAAFLVVGSAHRHGLGRRLLGGSAQLVIDGAGCPVAVAPPGYRLVGELTPAVVSVAFDGRPHSREALEVAASLATAARTQLRLVTVGDVAGVDLRPLPVEHVRLTGDPGRALVAETANTGLLVLGSHGRGPVRRALLGSVSAHVVREARCPVIVCPPG
jgi:nucleotide-binding universal stress UspA family protein